jgi:hypothetical protein
MIHGLAAATLAGTKTLARHVIGSDISAGRHFFDIDDQLDRLRHVWGLHMCPTRPPLDPTMKSKAKILMNPDVFH